MLGGDGEVAGGRLRSAFQHGELRGEVIGLEVNILAGFLVHAVAGDGAEDCDGRFHAGDLLLLFGGQGLHCVVSFRVRLTGEKILAETLVSVKRNYPLR